MKAGKLDISVLYVDDDVQACLLMGGLMRLYVREVVLAHDGAQGVAMFQQHRPDVVVTDFSMPVMDGGEMVRQIQAERPGIPVIFMSAHNEMWLAEQTGGDGTARRISKPIDVSKLLDMLGEVAS